MKLDIEKFDPCDDGLEWYTLQKSSIQAWNSCHRGEWMIWIAERLGVNEKKITLASAKCANTVRHLMKDERSTTAVDTTIAYGEGRATSEELEEARSEAYAAYIAAYAAYAAYADEVCNAAYAAYAAYWAAYAAYASAARTSSATHYASNAAYYAAGESQEAREANELQTANICREILTDDIIKIIEQC